MGMSLTKCQLLINRFLSIPKPFPKLDLPKLIIRIEYFEENCVAMKRFNEDIE